MPDSRDQSDLVIRYLLGVATDTERRVVEEQFFATDGDLNKLLQAEDDLIDDYVRGALSNSDRRLFESNFLCTERRRQQVELVKSFVETLAQVDVETSFASEQLGRTLPVKKRATAEGYDDSRQPTSSPAQLAVSHAQEWFSNFLHWLDPDVERAGEKYERIRRGLINLFATKGSDNPEELADVTIDRVCSRVPELSETYTGDPARYFYAVARNVLREAARSRASDHVTVVVEGTVNVADRTSDCLERCLEHFSESNRELILQYYSGEKGRMIANRNVLAESLGMTPSGLRIRVANLRRVLQKCVTSCLQEKNN